MKIVIRTQVSGNYQNVFAKFNRNLFERLIPPGHQVKIERFDGCQKNDEIHLKLSLLGKKMEWISVITEVKNAADECYFIDEGKSLPWPLKNWRHVHHVYKVSEEQSVICDEIDFSALFAPLIYPLLYAQFFYRKPIYKKYFQEI